MSDQFFPYEFDQRWKALFAVLGVDDADGVTIGESGSLLATYGRFRVSTHVDNVEYSKVTGPHRWYTAVGVRLSFSDDGLTFGTNHKLGLCIAFNERVPKVIGTKPHSALWVSVADPEALAAALV